MLRRIRFPFAALNRDCDVSPLLRALLAAGTTPYYAGKIGVEDDSSPEQKLARIPPIPPELVLANLPWFQAVEGSKPIRRPLRLWFQPQPRMAVLEARHIAPGRRIRHFEWDRMGELWRFEPGVIAAPIDVLVEVAREPLASLTHGVVALTRLGGRVLDDETRSRLWTAFRVPVFEQLEWFDGSLVAEECEAHGSLHLRTEEVRVEASESGEAILTLLSAAGVPALRIASGFSVRQECPVCGCGEVVPRLARRAAAMAAAALA